MLFWIICAVMTFAAAAAMLSPILRADRTILDASDVEVYKDQLIEITADEKRGLISPAEAVTARIEVSRRILKADGARDEAHSNTQQTFARIIIVMATLSIPAVSWALYGYLGSPNQPDQPIAMRMNKPAAEASMEVLVAKAEAHLTANPSDGKGWAVLAPIYLRLGRFDDAIQAFERATKLMGPSAVYEIGMGQAYTGRNGGLINDEARAAFMRATKLDPKNPEPQLLLATDLARQGKFSEAKLAFEAMLATAPANAPWRGMLVDMIARVDQALASASSEKTVGPTQSEVDQAATMSSTDRLAMIKGMVEQLDAKLADNPADKEGWKRLIRSYMVLNMPDKVQETIKRAKIGLSASSADIVEIDVFVEQLGIAKQ